MDPGLRWNADADRNANFGLKTPDRAAVNITGENEGMGDGDRSGFGADQSGGGAGGVDC
jgi:hypothetical protein